MGNSVADFKGTTQGFRDRHQTKIFGSDIGAPWFGSTPPLNTLYASGSSSRCVDYNNGLPYELFLKNRAKNTANSQARRDLDVGHPFAKESVSLSMPSVIDVKQLIAPPSTYRGYKGVFAPTVEYKNAMGQIAQGRFPSIPTELGTDILGLWSLGSSAIRRSLPDVPQFSLFRFVGELRAGLPKVPLKVLANERKLRNVGGEYLNVQFGIMPTISDLQNFIEAVSDPRLRAAVKHQLGEEHRVRKTIDKGRTSTTRSLSAVEMSTVNVQAGATGTSERVQSFEIWSSCSFAYFQVSALDSLLADLDARLGGVGAVPRAIDIWNLLPWSWLVDWFTNFNHVITNLSYLGRDGLYLQRGYLMAHYQDVTTVTQKCTSHGIPISTTGVWKTDRKYRVKASPFGFGYTWDGFDPFQLSILGALGISRLRH